ncbi:thrombospondin type-1 domain-containing protein 7A [Eurytemora carolleeae]|uniref:thrombospondin type-1 domain-containing protein 7A n=1 Tax=Eurytemora carolleeae TaxID=1294199 RepID=UPI000C75A76B|nr:thrombospondin type-1 domain-containing protein 7A [Eurytemora carolleeae]|eukprot:XP_023323749.1 thrombospondin type-1 domain-containing protein 7A-like [Eurytemora affinis]
MRKLNLILLLFPLAGSSFHPNVHTQGYWSPGVWEECRIFQTGSECGFGTQSRNVSCIGFPSSPPQVVKPILCSGLPKPDQERLCARRCSPDCQLGPWEAWGPCTCNRRAQARNVRGISKPEACAECADADSTRFRRVVVPPTGGGGSCPPKLQRRSCIPALCIKGPTTENVITES